ncbi:MAG: AzlD domain-containing protein [Spirochaetaceae bacterium]|jgi:branched-subunit amino acid transport protein AzlD|nr:AzlD domain-containing protein [Spirochaetaceae bacterium]
MPQVPQAVVYTFVMGAVIFFCRAAPFMFFRGGKPGGKGENRLFLFVERTAPPLAMTVLCFNAIAAPIKEKPGEALPVAAASVLTALLHLWKRNALLSIFSGVAFYMLIRRWL